ncbi:MAG: methionine--tRNA ligase subunit beta [Candidatus Omnitrophota bacterium]
MISFEDFKKIDLRIAEIVSVEEHSNADKLYIIQISLGDEKKQIVAGLRANYSPEELIGKKVVVINNLDPVVIRGEESNGMLLAASSENGPVILMPEKNVEAGAVIG